MVGEGVEGNAGIGGGFACWKQGLCGPALRLAAGFKLGKHPRATSSRLLVLGRTCATKPSQVGTVSFTALRCLISWTDTATLHPLLLIP
jgi:hypothetical protein